MTLGYSRRGFALGFLRERMHDLLGAHEGAFAHFGGRCEFLLYDRMVTVVLGTSQGRPGLNPTFANFAAHWGFTPPAVPAVPCPDQGQGRVRSEVRQAQLRSRSAVP